MRKLSMFAFGLLLVAVAGCGGESAAVSDYVESLNAANAEFSPRGEAMWNRFLALPSPTLDDVQRFLSEAAAFRREVEDSVWRDLDVPEEIEDLHEPLAVWHSRLVDAVERLAERATTVADVEQLVETSEFATYQQTFTDGASVCRAVEDTLNSPDLRDAFAGSAWMPNDLRDAVFVTLPCEMPEDLTGLFLRQAPGE